MADRRDSPSLGLGALWRPRSAQSVGQEIERGRLGFVEVIAESVHRSVPRDLARARAAGVQIVPHGVGLGLAGAARPDRRRVADLARAAEACEAPLVSEHIAFVRAGGLESGHLLPVPRTRAMLDVLVANVRQARAVLPVPLALEPVATLVEWPGAEMTEAEFLTSLVERADVGLVLDLANLHVNAANRRRARALGRMPASPSEPSSATDGGGVEPGPGGALDSDTDPVALLDRIPLEKIAYVHVAGGRIRDGRWHDTHTEPLWPEVPDLVTELWARIEPPGLLLERDDGHRDTADLGAELDLLAAAMEAGRARRAKRDAGRAQAITTVPQLRSEPGPSSVVAQSAPTAEPDEVSTGAGTATRKVLRGQQEALLRAAVGVGATPSGFDPEDLAAVGAVLARKRARAVAHLVPDLAVLPDYVDRFVAWAEGHPLGKELAAGDAVRFFRSLPVAERTPHAAAAVAWLAVGRWAPLPFCLCLYRACDSLAVGVRFGAFRKMFRVRGCRRSL